MSRKEHYILAALLGVGLVALGWVENGFKGIVKSLGLGIAGYVIGRSL